MRIALAVLLIATVAFGAVGLFLMFRDGPGWTSSTFALIGLSLGVVRLYLLDWYLRLTYEHRTPESDGAEADQSAAQ